MSFVPFPGNAISGGWGWGISPELSSVVCFCCAFLSDQPVSNPCLSESSLLAYPESGRVTEPRLGTVHIQGLREAGQPGIREHGFGFQVGCVRLCTDWSLTLHTLP